MLHRFIFDINLKELGQLLLLLLEGVGLILEYFLLVVLKSLLAILVLFLNFVHLLLMVLPYSFEKVSEICLVFSYFLLFLLNFKFKQVFWVFWPLQAWALGL